VGYLSDTATKREKADRQFHVRVRELIVCADASMHQSHSVDANNALSIELTLISVFSTGTTPLGIRNNQKTQTNS
jgi:hypothetical protein